MSDTWVGPGWWLANDGRWYPPNDPDDVVVLDLRGSEPVLDLRTVSAEPLVPPPIPGADRAGTPAVSQVEGRSSLRSRGGRWGRHRVVANPRDSSPTD